MTFLNEHQRNTLGDLKAYRIIGYRSEAGGELSPIVRRKDGSRFLIAPSGRLVTIGDLIEVQSYLGLEGA